jgi:hypothetical protein
MTADELREQFIGWQCRMRQYSVRKDEGRPSPAMCPVLEVKDQTLGPINIQVVKADEDDTTREFQFMVQRTQDPKDVYENAVKLLSEYYYQVPAEFSEELTAIYSMQSELADQIVEVGSCTLLFDQGNQIYKLNCTARFIEHEHQLHQATYWHNRLFNPALPGRVKVIGFLPDWETSTFSTGQM